MQLSSRFASHSPVLRADHTLSDDQIRTVAPSIFAEDKHASRSDRYAYIPTGAMLSELRKEGFQHVMVCQTRVRDEGKREPGVPPPLSFHLYRVASIKHAGRLRQTLFAGADIHCRGIGTGVAKNFLDHI